MSNQDDNRHCRLYKDLAWTWPIISPPHEYVDETLEMINFLKQYAKLEIRQVLNLGCGGGHNDYTIKKHYNVTSVDISEDMLALARALNPEVDYHRGDMRSVRLNRQFDAVAIFDSINYMLTADDLTAAFVTAYEHLRGGGVMVTYLDEWAEKFQQNKTIHLTRQKEDIEITLIENYYDPDPDDTWYEDNMIYLIRRSGELTIELDYHRLGLFTLETWSKLMEKAGFQVYRQVSSIPNGAGEECPAFVGLKI